jgi:hypothetical protein
MYMLVYVSSAVELFSDAELDQLLATSRGNNSARGVTGLLLYKDGNFMQFLEGPKQQVLEVMNKVKTDSRHRGVIVLLQEEHEGREFDEWSMGFKKLQGQQGAAGYNEVLNLPLTSEEFLLHPSKSLQLLLSFKSAMR